MSTRTPADPSRVGASASSVGAAFLCCCVLAMAQLTAARAQSLLPNGEFDTDIVGWITAGSGSAVAWTTIDHSGCPPEVSGALFHVNFATAAGVQRSSAACVTDIVGNETYSFGADLHFPTEQDRTGEAEIVVVWFDTPDCTGLSGDSTAGDTTVDTSTAGTWVQVRNDAATAPADATSAAFAVRLTKHEAGSSLALAYDGAYLVVDGLVYLFNEAFDRESSCHWSVTVP